MRAGLARAAVGGLVYAKARKEVAFCRGSRLSSVGGALEQPLPGAATTWPWGVCMNPFLARQGIWRRGCGLPRLRSTRERGTGIGHDCRRDRLAALPDRGRQGSSVPRLSSRRAACRIDDRAAAGKDRRLAGAGHRADGDLLLRRTAIVAGAERDGIHRRRSASLQCRLRAADPADLLAAARSGRPPEVEVPRGRPGKEGEGEGACPAPRLHAGYAASTSTSSLSSTAVMRSTSSSLIATPSRALTRRPLISIAPVAGTR